MNVLAAIAHACIWYGIRRKCWPEDSIVHLVQGDWKLIDVGDGVNEGQTYHLQPGDLDSSDWEDI